MMDGWYASAKRSTMLVFTTLYPFLRPKFASGFYGHFARLPILRPSSRSPFYLGWGKPARGHARIEQILKKAQT
jgi:hypothetical protein